MALYILIDKDWNVYTGNNAISRTEWKTKETKQGHRYIRVNYEGNHYYYCMANKWYRQHKIPDKVLSFLFLSYPDLYAQVAKAFNL